MFVLEKGIKVPPQAYKQTKYPFKEMEVGDSFTLMGTDREHNNVRFAASAAGKRYGTQFVCRTFCKNGATGIRCWRVA